MVDTLVPNADLVYLLADRFDTDAFEPELFLVRLQKQIEVSIAGQEFQIRQLDFLAAIRDFGLLRE